MNGPRVISRFVARAPALPVVREGTPEEERLVDAALALAGATDKGEAARASYLTRMGFRPTPSGLWAGVCVGTIGSRTEIRTSGAPMRAHLHVTWARLRSLARALLDDEAVRRRVRLRVAPSYLGDGAVAMWLGAGEGASVPVERAPIDPLLGAVIAAAQHGARWPVVRRAAERASGADADSIDDYLLTLLDAGLLVDDLGPALVGPPPIVALAARLAEIPAAREVGAALAALHTDLAPGKRARGSQAARMAELRARIDALPGDAQAAARPPLDAILELRPAHLSLARDAVERAAALLPLLLRLQSAFGPTWERATSPALDGAIVTLMEDHGPGGYEPAGLALGRYGVTVGEPAPPLLATGFPTEPDAPRFADAVPAPLVRLLVSRLAALAPGAPLELTPEELDAALPECDVPPTMELVISPMREDAGAPSGTGWLVGLHGPAGATWGRFAHALGPALGRAFTELFAVERAQLGEDVVPVDLAYAPSAAVADVACHPALRVATLTLSGWPAAPGAIGASDVELVLGARLAVEGVQGAPSALGLRHAGSATPLCAAPLARLRGTTVAGDGVHRLLAGFGLVRASAPWVLAPSALGRAPRLPRVVVDGFVIAPASFAVPAEVAAACRGGEGRAALDAWRARAGVPRMVQVGEEDQLLPADLDDDGAPARIARLAAEAPNARAFEIWPPLDRLADESGRRVEAVVAVALGSAATLAAEAPGTVDPRPDHAWLSLRLVGPADRADGLLVEQVAPFLDSARAGGELAGWFFLRYRDEGGRAHLRLRLRADGDRVALHERWSRQLREAVEPRCADGALVRLELDAYRPERLRWGPGRGVAIAEAIFEADSELVLALVGLDPEARPDGMLLAVRSFDALGAGLGLDLDARRAAATAARARHATRLRPDAAAPDPLAPLYRAHQATLHTMLAGDRGLSRTGDAATSAFHAHARRLRALRVRPAISNHLLAPLLHLASVRLVGPDFDREAIASYLWQRTLDSLAARHR